jgi:hypothetical protein
VSSPPVSLFSPTVSCASPRRLRRILASICPPSYKS